MTGRCVPAVGLAVVLLAVLAAACASGTSEGGGTAAAGPVVPASQPPTGPDAAARPLPGGPVDEATLPVRAPAPARPGETVLEGTRFRWVAAPPGTVPAVDRAAAERLATGVGASGSPPPEALLALLTTGAAPPTLAWVFTYRDTVPFRGGGPPDAEHPAVLCDSFTMIDATTGAERGTVQICRPRPPDMPGGVSGPRPTRGR